MLAPIESSILLAVNSKRLCRGLIDYFLQCAQRHTAICVFLPSLSAIAFEFTLRCGMLWYKACLYSSQTYKVEN